MKFGFDIDDTLLNLRERAFTIFNAKLNRNVDIETFRSLRTIPVHDAFGLSPEEGRKLWNLHREEVFYSASPFEEAVETLVELDRQGHEVYYVTAREAEHCGKTRDMLIRNGFPVREGRFYCGMADLEKARIIDELGLDYFFDDKPVVLESLAGMKLKVYVRDNSYNRHLDLPRIVNWSELLDIVSKEK
ncbi:5' nucleotidase, NT5C type [Cohnella soli]|uniref:Nucleotidase n=1 Tax=Cohnella soli TaxID=425005 RepID=A0ABW0HMV0_9BACL